MPLKGPMREISRPSRNTIASPCSGSQLHSHSRETYQVPSSRTRWAGSPRVSWVHTPPGAWISGALLELVGGSNVSLVPVHELLHLDDLLRSVEVAVVDGLPSGVHDLWAQPAGGDDAGLERGGMLRLVHVDHVRAWRAERRGLQRGALVPVQVLIVRESAEPGERNMQGPR